MSELPQRLLYAEAPYRPDGWIMTQPLEPISKAAMPRLTRNTAAQIICGNCCGDGDVPRLTFETADNTCADCGGRNYVVAPEQRPLPTERTQDNGQNNSNGRSTGGR